MTVLKRSRDGGVLTLTLNRADSLNALGDDLRAELLSAFDVAAEDDEVSCLVLTGAGKAFSAGGDINRMAERHKEGDVSPSEYQTHLRETAQPLVERLYHLDLPTVAKVSGPAVGAGLGLALACDVVYADETARFGATFRRVGLGPDAGTSFTLATLVGPQVALELLYTGDVVSAERAVDIGLVTRVYDPDNLDDAVAKRATHIASGPTRALVEAKHLVHANHDRNQRAGLEAEAATQALLYDTRDHKEGVAAFLEDRDPEFEGR